MQEQSRQVVGKKGSRCGKESLGPAWSPSLISGQGSYRTARWEWLTPQRTKSTERSRQVIENNRWLFVSAAARPSETPVGTGGVSVSLASGHDSKPDAGTALPPRTKMRNKAVNLLNTRDSMKWRGGFGTPLSPWRRMPSWCRWCPLGPGGVGYPVPWGKM